MWKCVVSLNCAVQYENYPSSVQTYVVKKAQSKAREEIIKEKIEHNISIK